MRHNITPYTQTINSTTYRGDTFHTFPVRVINDDGAPVFYADSRVWFGVFRGGNPAILKNYDGSARDENGYIICGLTPAESAQLAAGDYDYEVECCIDDENDYTAIVGTLTVRADLITAEVRDEFES